MIEVGEALELLDKGDLEVLGLLPYSSNYVFLASVSAAGSEMLAVYKPTRGERPLWDFPVGTLAAREVAAFQLSDAAGWDLVPPTVLRRDAPLGPGSLQLFIEHDPERHSFVLAEERLWDLRPIAAFDVMINNADRKAGHVIEDGSGRLWSVDHGLSFNVAPKLRTVIWAFAGEPVGSEVTQLLANAHRLLQIANGLTRALERLISPQEVEATLHRLESFMRRGCFPSPRPDEHHLPWPLV